MSRNFLTVVLAGVVAVAVYSAMTVSKVEGYPALVAMALGVFGAFVLFLGGLIDSKDAQKGLLPAIASVLPRLLDWASENRSRATGIALFSMGFAAGIYWVGPAGVATVSIACDEADHITLDGTIRKPCSAAFSTRLWRPPWRRIEQAQLTLGCEVERGMAIDRWTGDWPGRRCGQRPLLVEYIYNGIDLPEEIERAKKTSVEARRIALGHAALSEILKDVPPRANTDNLIFATWNIRSFGGGVRHIAAEPRRSEALIYMAHTLSHFDLIAVQEVYDETLLVDLIKLMGPDYAHVLGAPSPGRCGGGREGLGERLGFIYDRRKLQILNDSTTVVVAAEQNRKMLQEYPEWKEILKGRQEQPCRPPFFARFNVQGVPLSAFTLHAMWGSSGGPKLGLRLADVYRTLSYFANYQRNALPDETMLFGGDLNGIGTGGPVQQVGEALGFDFLGPEYQVPTNSSGNAPYDRVGGLFPEGNRFEAARHGTVDLFSVVMREDQRLEYRPYYAEKLRIRAAEGRPVRNEENFYLFWRTYQLSDHRPRWVEFRILRD